MKKLAIITTLLLYLTFLFGMTSCIVFTAKDSGRHRGWYKNSNNPHHPNSTNPGKSKRH